MEARIERRGFTGGVDSDSADFAIGKDGLLDAVNVRVLSGENNGTASFIPGNVLVGAVNDILPAGTLTLLGHCISAERNCLYLFLHNASGNHAIVEFNKIAVTARIVIDNSHITGGFGWTSGMFISCAVSGDLLGFTEPTHDVRYLNLETDYMAGGAI